MFPSLRRRDPALFLGALLAGSFVFACSRPVDRAPNTESASSTTPPDTTATPVGAAASSTATEKPAAASAGAESTATRQDTGVAKTTSKKARPLPRPSIDPGRMPPKSHGDSTPAKPAADSATASANDASPGQGQPVKYDAASNTATFDLIAGPFNWNGFGSGSATLTLPPNANVVINFVNKDGTPHSAEVISGEGPVPNAAGDPAIPRAYTNKVLEGLPQEASDVLRFTVPATGTYRIFCGVPGHGLSGMWIWMKVDPTAKAASFGPTKT